VASAEPGPDGAPQSRVSITCEADLQGVIADFARTGGVAVARVLMQDFARRLAAELSAGGDASQPGGDNAVSGARVMWDVVKDRSAGLVQKLGPKKDGAS
jgi:hypothetical protein